jgi:tetratricopeptide (TPR) repeat protein
MCFDKRVEEVEDYPILEEAETYFSVAFDEGEPISGLYLWKIYQMQGTPNKGKEYLAEVGKRLEMMNSAKEYNNAADVLRSFGEYEMALPYIETCLSMVDEEDHPTYLETYAAVLYGLGERVKAEKTFARCMNIYQKECRNRDLRETWETMKEKFSDSVSFRLSIPQMEECWGLAKKQV